MFSRRSRVHDVDLSPGRSQRPIHVRKLRVKIDYKRRKRQNKPCLSTGSGRTRTAVSPRISQFTFPIMSWTIAMRKEVVRSGWLVLLGSCLAAKWSSMGTHILRL